MTTHNPICGVPIADIQVLTGHDVDLRFGITLPDILKPRRRQTQRPYHPLPIHIPMHRKITTLDRPVLHMPIPFPMAIDPIRQLSRKIHTVADKPEKLQHTVI